MSNTKSNKLYKTSDGASLGGVCAGISEVYNLDVSVVRILTVLITVLVSGFPLIVYLVMYLVLPDKKDVVKEVVETQKKDDYTFEEDDYIF